MGISLESFRQQLARLAKLEVNEVDLDKYAEEMELTEAELKAVETELKTRQVDSRQLVVFD